MPRTQPAFYRLNPQTLTPFNTSPVDLQGEVDLQRNRIVIAGAAAYENSRWRHIGVQTPPIQAVSFGFSVQVSSLTVTGRCSVKVIDEKDKPLIGISYIYDCSAHPYSSEHLKNVYQGFGQDAAGRQTQIIENAPPTQAQSVKTLNLSNDAQVGQWGCSIADHPLHFVRARLDKFKIEFSFDALGIGGEYQVCFEEIFFSSLDGHPPAVFGDQASSKQKVFSLVSAAQPAVAGYIIHPQIASTTVLIPTQEVRIEPREKRILFLAAEPVDQHRLYIHKELHKIQECLRPARNPFRLYMQPSTRQADILQALLDVRPHIVHFAGHGTHSGELCFETMDGKSDPAPAEYLSRLFEPFSSDLQCVVLNACYSDSQARAIAQHIPVVIGVKREIADEAAIVFAQGFYTALVAGEPLEAAFKMGVSEIARVSDVDVLAPVLISNRS